VLAWVPGGDRFVGEQVEVEVGAQLADQLAALDAVLGSVPGRRLRTDVDELVQQRQPCGGVQRQVAANDAGLDLVVECHRRQRIFHAAHHQQP
jgi:hypothetical protein